MVKRIPESLVNIAKRFRYSVDDLCPDDAMSTATFSPAKLGPSVEDTEGSLKEDSLEIPEYVQASNEDGTTDAESKLKAMTFEEGLPKLLFEDLQSDNPGTVALAARDIGDLLSIAAPLQEKVHQDFVDLGGHATLLHTLRKWHAIADIQSELAHCVARMVHLNGKTVANNDDEGDESNLISSFLKMGGLHEVYRALVTFKNSVDVQSNSMLALANLCGDNDMKSAAEAAKQFVLDLEGVPLVTKAMKTFPDQETVQENGCWLLNNLCRAGGRQESMVIKAKALMVVASSVQQFPENSNITKDAHELMNAVLSVDKKA